MALKGQPLKSPENETLKGPKPQKPMAGARTESAENISTETQAYYRAVSRNILLTILIASFVPLVLVSGLILYQFRVSYHEKVSAHLQELVQKHKQNIDTF